MANNVTSEYIGEQSANPLQLAFPKEFGAAYGNLLLPRPMFTDRAEIHHFSDDLTALFDVLTSLPERCFGGDLARYCAAIGMDERMSALFHAGAGHQVPLYARADAYHDGTSFKILEFNIGTETGGADMAQANRAYLAADSFRDFGRRHGLSYTDTARRLAAGLREAGSATASDANPVVALVEAPGGLRSYERVFAALKEGLAGHGVDLLLGEIQQLREDRNGKIVLKGAPVDVILRYFTAGELLDHPETKAALDLVLEAHATGKTALFSPLESTLFASKGALGLVHDREVRAELTPAERAAVDRIVPWTGVLHDDLDYCAANRESLILKPGVGYGATGVIIGRDTTDADWLAALEAARGQDHVVQELVSPAAEPVFDPSTGTVENWRSNWGIFVNGDGYAGAFVRALKARDGAVIAFSNAATRAACVFTYEQGAA